MSQTIDTPARLGCPSRRYVGGSIFAACGCLDRCPAPEYAPTVDETQPRAPLYHPVRRIDREEVPQAPNVAAYLERKTVPLPGDVVRLAVDWYGSNTAGTFGVLDGIEGQPRDAYLCVFHPSAFRGPSSAFGADRGVYVSCSGGPAPFVEAADLVWTGETRRHGFWMWRATPQAQGGVEYLLEVPVWDWTPPAR